MPIKRNAYKGAGLDRQRSKLAYNNQKYDTPIPLAQPNKIWPNTPLDVEDEPELEQGVCRSCIAGIDFEYSPPRIKSDFVGTVVDSFRLEYEVYKNFVDWPTELQTGISIGTTELMITIDHGGSARILVSARLYVDGFAQFVYQGGECPVDV